MFILIEKMIFEVIFAIFLVNFELKEKRGRQIVVVPLGKSKKLKSE